MQVFDLKQAKIQLGRFLVVLVSCAMLLFNTAAPAFADHHANSRPSEGTAQMNDLQETSKRALEREPRGKNEVRGQAQKGPNSVQGDADVGKMNSVGNSSAKTVRDQLEDALDSVTPGR